MLRVVLALGIGMLIVILVVFHFYYGGKIVIAFVNNNGNIRKLVNLKSLLSGNSSGGNNQKLELFINGKRVKVKKNPLVYRVYRRGRHEILVIYGDGRVDTAHVEDIENVKYIEFEVEH